ncbi:MAG: recombinase family protein [Tetrasphaera sp.]|nr:recombinase family protein [Tetrasphaera sp.]
MSLHAVVPLAAVTAVSYLRVSTKEQAERDGDPEGYSIPAQRAANSRKAHSLGAVIVEEFVDRGESARSADREELKRMLAYIQDKPVKYVIVHKVDRLARNRIDDVEISLALKNAGVTLVSASENIDETPSGMLLHGIMSSIAEFYSRNLATEVVKGMSQKAKTGGTPGRAPIGYRNVIQNNDSGKPVRTIALDPTRAPLIAWAFEAYATGDWTLLKLATELEARGLTTVPTAKAPAKAVRRTQLHAILSNPYYKGVVTYRGIQYPNGRHDKLVDATTWARVQDVLASHRHGEKEREHPHYLRGSIFCGHCASRFIVTIARPRPGQEYPYFVCIGRHQKTTSCERRAAPISLIEELVEVEYARIRLAPEQRQAIQSAVEDYIDRRRDDSEQEVRSLTRQRQRLLDERGKLLQAHYADAIPLDLMKSEQDRIGRQLDQIEGRLAAQATTTTIQKETLTRALDLLENCAQLYEHASDADRRILNQAIFTRIWVYDETVTGELDDLLAMLTHPDLMVLLGAE